MNRIIWLLASTTVLLGAGPALAGVSAGFRLEAPSPCISPCAIYVDGAGESSSPYTNSTQSGVREFHDVHFSWNFGDPQSGTWSTTGRSRNQAIGPHAAHVFELPEGSGDKVFTVTLNVIGPDGSTSSTSRTIRVVGPASQSTVCVSRTSDTSGCPSGAAKVTNAGGSWAGVIDSQLSKGHKRVLFRRGQTWSSSDSWSLQGSGGVFIGAFGPSGDARPKIQFSAKKAITTSNDSNVRVADFEFQGIADDTSIMIDGYDGSTDLLFLRIKGTPGTWHKGASLSWQAQRHKRVMVVDSNWTNMGFGSGGNIFFGHLEHGVLMGNVMRDSRGGEHVVRIASVHGAVIAENVLAENSDKKSVLTIRATDGGESYDVLVVGNIILGTDDLPFAFVGANRSTATVSGRDFFVEGNFIAHASGTNYGVQTGINCANGVNHVTVRNNLVDMSGWQSHRGFKSNGCKNVRAHNNSCYTSDNSINAKCVVFSGGEGRARNNLIYAPNAGEPDAVIVNSGSVVQGSNLTASQNPYVASQPHSPSDFQLRVGSSALGAGTSNFSQEVSLPRADYVGVLRSSSFSAGAWQSSGGSGSSPPPPPPPPESLDPPFLH